MKKIQVRDIKVQPEMPFIELDGIKHYLPEGAVRLFIALRPSEWVRLEDLAERLNVRKSAIRYFATRLRHVLNPHGIHIHSHNPGGYRLARGKNTFNRYKKESQ